MNEKIKIIIADDNKGFCDILSKFLSKYEDIEILGIAYSDEEEIELIEKNNPEIVITDLLRNHKPTGAEIIKKYNRMNNGPEFFVITADGNEDAIKNGLKVASYLRKPFWDYDIIVQELRRIKNEIEQTKNQIVVAKTGQILEIGILNRFFGLFKIRK